MSSLKKIKKPRLIKIMRELKNVEDALEETNKIVELETEIESTKRKSSATETEQITKINKLEKYLKIETVKRRMKEKPMSFKTKKKFCDR